MGAEKKRAFLNTTKQEFYRAVKSYQQQLTPTKEIEGYGSAPLVGEKGYPQLRVHSISNQDQRATFYHTGELVKQDYKDIISHKAKNILGSTTPTYTRQTSNRLTKELQDIYKAKKPTEFASHFAEELRFERVVFDKTAGVLGSNNQLTSLQVTENPATSRQIEKFAADDIKAREAMISLYERGHNEHQIMHLLSLGTFGVNSHQRLVPSRWAMSAYDNTIENHLYHTFIRQPVINRYEAYHYQDKGNNFLIILLPYPFLGEVIEQFSTALEKDFISHENRLDKKEPETAGGYYATKVGIFEHLRRRRHQAAFVSIRIIDGYDLPLGVVFVRECVRQAMQDAPVISSSSYGEFRQELALRYPHHCFYFERSRVPRELSRQKRLTDF